MTNHMKIKYLQGFQCYRIYYRGELSYYDTHRELLDYICNLGGYDFIPIIFEYY